MGRRSSDMAKMMAKYGWQLHRVTSKSHLVWECPCGSCPRLVTGGTESEVRGARNAEARARRCPASGYGKAR